jgi:hypothetical protein
MNLLMLKHEASRLGSQQEQSHGRITSELAVAATHDRRHARYGVMYGVRQVPL